MNTIRVQANKVVIFVDEILVEKRITKKFKIQKSQQNNI
jgi:hypothetical protein